MENQFLPHSCTMKKGTDSPMNQLEYPDKTKTSANVTIGPLDCSCFY